MITFGKLEPKQRKVPEDVGGGTKKQLQALMVGIKRTVTLECIYGCVLLVPLAVGIYICFGHSMIRYLYASHFPIVEKWLMKGRGITPVEDYLDGADAMVLHAAFLFGTLLLASVCIVKWPRKSLDVFCGALIGSFSFFYLTDRFPSIANAFHLEVIRYYGLKERFSVDSDLEVKQSPLLHEILYDPGASTYPPLYGVDIVPVKNEWITDKDGFRNSRPIVRADIAVFGDGFIINGVDESDTFDKRLEKHLGNLTVANFGEDGHGPVQYFDVYKQYARKVHPKYALIGFNEGNDLEDIRPFLRWQATREPTGFAAVIESPSLWNRYGVAIKDTAQFIGERLFYIFHVALQYSDAYYGYPTPMPRELASVNVGNGPEQRMLFTAKLNTKQVAEILHSEECYLLRRVLANFVNLSAIDKTTVVFMFIPSAAHIYAQYSTPDSGRDWLKLRDEQIAAKANLEKAMLSLCRQLGIKYIDLSVPFEAAAKEGKILYNPLNSHWNSEGMEIAARYVADALQTKATVRPTIVTTRQGKQKSVTNPALAVAN